MERLKRLKIYSPWTIRNRMFWYLLNNLVLPYLVSLRYGWWGAYYFIWIAVVSILLLETINYIEHYGLLRKEISPGVYEKVDLRHSWNAP